MARSRRSRPSLLTLAVPIAAAAFVAAAATVLYAERRLSRMVLGGPGEGFPTKVFGAPYRLGGRARPSPERLLARLERLGYRRVRSVPARAGEYAWDPPVLAVRLRGFRLPFLFQPEGLVLLDEGAGQSWSLKSPSGEPLDSAALEPELLDELSGPQRIRRDPAAWEEFPQALVQAVVAAEDKRFFRHRGVDPLALARAAWSNVARDGVLQGGSTITQQLAKNLFLSPRRTLRRKAVEAALALYLEARFEKREILTHYLNNIYLGQDGPVGVVGTKAAALFYFGREFKDLGLAECAALAGFIRSPYRYNPWRDPKAAKGRRDFVLERMRAEGMIPAAAAERAKAAPLKLRPAPPSRKEREEHAYFVAEVVRRLLPGYGEETLFRSGLQIHTTLDPLLQKAAQAAVRRARRQGALAALDPSDGRVLALVGGKDFAASQFNRATQALRQPGSAFKPFVYGAALENGFTPAALLSDEPREYGSREGGQSGWRPQNFGGVYHGTATLRAALALSLNAATLDLARQVGPARVVDFARRMGIQSPIEPSLGVALGASEVTLLELAAAYSPFANGGYRVQPRLVQSVLDAAGGVLEQGASVREQALDPALAFLVTSILESAVREGTASVLSRLGWTRPAAGKTGTTNDGRDAWFVGYTPGLLAGVWVGDDRHRAVGVTGAKDAVPVWAAFMKEAAKEEAPAGFPRPEGLVRSVIDPLSGLLAVSGCPERREEWFAAGTEPRESCRLHRGGILGWFRRLFR